MAVSLQDNEGCAQLDWLSAIEMNYPPRYSALARGEPSPRASTSRSSASRSAAIRSSSSRSASTESMEMVEQVEASETSESLRTRSPLRSRSGGQDGHTFTDEEGREVQFGHANAQKPLLSGSWLPGSGSEDRYDHAVRDCLNLYNF